MLKSRMILLMAIEARIPLAAIAAEVRILVHGYPAYPKQTFREKKSQNVKIMAIAVDRNILEILSLRNNLFPFICSLLP